MKHKSVSTLSLSFAALVALGGIAWEVSSADTPMDYTEAKTMRFLQTPKDGFDKETSLQKTDTLQKGTVLGIGVL